MHLHLCSINSLSPVNLIKFVDSFRPYRNPLWSFGVFTMVDSCYHNTDMLTPCLQLPGQWHAGGNASLKVQLNLHIKQKAQATMQAQWTIVVSPGNCASGCCIGKCSRLSHWHAQHWDQLKSMHLYSMTFIERMNLKQVTLINWEFICGQGKQCSLQQLFPEEQW